VLAGRVITVHAIASGDVNAALRRRNAYFGSGDAAFPDRYEASASWPRVAAGTIAVEGGWRVYSSGPGLYFAMLIRHVLGVRRSFGQRIERPLLPAALAASKLAWLATRSFGARNVTPTR
jgi:cellobiose phosphorylase